MTSIAVDDPAAGLEAPVRRALASGDLDGATTAALRTYGPEIYGFLVALARDEAMAADAFSTFGERLWKTLERFEWRCTLRAWCYRLARNALTDLRRGIRATIPLSAIGEIADQVRTETATFLRTDVKHEVRALREMLSPEDQELLVLRIDRDLAWDELARVFADQELDERELARENARLRKRFQLVKRQFLALAKERGLKS